MNHRETTHPLSRLRKAFHGLSWLLLPTLAPAGLLASTRPRELPGLPVGQPGAESLPYLAAVGAPALRFLPAEPAPDLVSRPPAAGPPVPGPVRTAPAVAPSHAATPPAAAHDPADSPAVEPGAEPAKGRSLPILHDELRTQVRPEDFLPYFQVPGSATQPGAMVIPSAYAPRGAPEPAPLPPSSATYTQTPQ